MKTILEVKRNDIYTQKKCYCKLIKNDEGNYLRIYKYNTMKIEDITEYNNYTEAYGGFMKVTLFLLQ